MTTRAYARVSTADQATSGHGLDAQRAAIFAEAERRGWDDLVWYVDGGVSGKDLDRPQMARLLRDLRRGDQLVVSKLDRLSRSLSDFAQLMERAQRQRWNLIALDLAIDVATPNGELMASILAAMSRWERRLIGQRTAEGLAAAKAKGRLPGRRSRLPRATQDRLIELRDQCVTLARVADQLNAEGLCTATGRPWTTAAVRSSERSARLERTARRQELSLRREP